MKLKSQCTANPIRALYGHSEIVHGWWSSTNIAGHQDVQHCLGSSISGRATTKGRGLNTLAGTTRGGCVVLNCKCLGLTQ